MGAGAAPAPADAPGLGGSGAHLADRRRRGGRKPHISNFDPLALGHFLAYAGRWPRYLAKESLFSSRLLGWLLRGTGQIPVRRDSQDASAALRDAVRAVEQGRCVVIYPEATITADPGLWPMRGKTGAARLALSTGCPVVPVGQWGAQEVWYRKRLGVPRLLPRKTMRLLAGPPVPLDDLRAQPIALGSITEATDRILDAITALVAKLRDESAPAGRWDPT